MIIREINNSPVEIKLLALITVFLWCSVFRFSSTFLSSFLTLLPHQTWKFTQRECLFLSLSPFISHFAPSPSVLPSFPPKGVPQLADSLWEIITSLEENVVACSKCLFQTWMLKILYGCRHCSTVVPSCSSFSFLHSVWLFYSSYVMVEVIMSCIHSCI